MQGGVFLVVDHFLGEAEDDRGEFWLKENLRLPQADNNDN